jgi:ABC-type branched-subunit amino acid transport system substrate-binding protein
MRLMLSAIRRATDGGRKPARRSAVVRAIFDTHDRRSVLGTYSIDPRGDTTLKAYGVWRVFDGSLRFWKAMQGG